MEGSRTLLSVEDLNRVVREIKNDFQPRQLILLQGPMGAGKTEFVKALVKACGGGEVSSPTFALHHRYQTKSGVVDHLDLFRLKSAGELEESGFWDLFLAPTGLIVVEWADRLDSSVWPSDWHPKVISLAVVDGGARLMNVSDL